MLEEWTSAAKPKLDQALLVEHIEKMVEVREAKGGGSKGLVPEDSPGSSPANVHSRSGTQPKDGASWKRWEVVGDDEWQH